MNNKNNSNRCGTPRSKSTPTPTPTPTPTTKSLTGRVLTESNEGQTPSSSRRGKPAPAVRTPVMKVTVKASTATATSTLTPTGRGQRGGGRGGGNQSQPSNLNTKVTPGTKSTPLPFATPAQGTVSKLHEKVRLKNDIVMVREELAEKTVKIKELEEHVAKKDEVIGELKTDKEKLKSRLEQLNTELRMLHGLLNDEMEMRLFVQEENKGESKDVASKLLKIEAELALKNELIKSKTDLINQQEHQVSSLREELLRMRKEMSEIQGNISSNSRTCRGSISNLQSTLTTRLQDVEQKFKEKEKEHKEELVELRQAYEGKIDGLRNQVQNNERTIEELRGRLQECRQARDYSLLEARTAEFKMESATETLRAELDKARMEIAKLENQLKLEEEYSLHAQVVEGQLEQALRINAELRSNVEELEEIRKALQTQTEEIDELKTKLKEAEQKKQTRELQEIPDVSDRGSTRERCDMQSLIQKREAEVAEKASELSKLHDQLQTLEKNFGLTKVDLRLALREKKYEAERCSHLSETNAVLQKQVDSKEVEITRLLKRVEELEATVHDASGAIKSKEHESLAASQTASAAKEELSELRKTVAEAKTELADYKQRCDMLEAELERRNNDLKKKTSDLQMAEQKAIARQMNLSLLKEACTVMDGQLKDFEKAFEEKAREAELLLQTKEVLEKENTSLKQSLQKVKDELLEAKGSRLYIENKLKTSTQESVSAEKIHAGELKSLHQKLKELTDKNAQLMTQLMLVKNDLNDALLEEKSIEKKLQSVMDEKDRLSRELRGTCDKNNELAEDLETLRSALSDALDKAEEYRQRYDILSSQQEFVDHEVIEKTVQLRSTIRQQAKLIDYLQRQNESLLKKKERWFQLFHRSKEELSSSPRNVPDPTDKLLEIPPTLTPVHLIKEHFDVERLEKVADRLRNQLAMLHEQKLKVESSSPRQSRKEECLLLKDKENLEPKPEPCTENCDAQSPSP